MTPILLGENYKFWLADSTLFQDPNVSSREICKYKDHSLQLNCPSQIVNELEQIITLATEDLSKQFEKNFKGYGGYRKVIAKLSCRIRQSSFFEASKDLVTDVLSKVTA